MSLPNNFVWDDEQFIYKNSFILNFELNKIITSSITSGAGIESNYYRPITATTFALDTALWGVRPAPMRAVNIILHALTATAIFFLLKNLGASGRGATFISAIFLFHPIALESIIYINSRGDSLYSLFLILGLIAWQKALSFSKKTISIFGITYSISKTQLIIVSLILYLMALFSKEIAIIGIFFYIYIGLWHIFTNRENRELIKSTQIKEKIFAYLVKDKTIPITIFFLTLISISYLSIRTLVLGSNSFSLSTGIELYDNNLWIRVHTFVKILHFYLAKIFWPHPLHMEYIVEPITTVFSWWLVSFTAILFIIVALSLVEAKQNRYWIGLGLLWFITPLVPVSGILPINGMMYHHWLYFPIIGFGLIIYGLFLLLKFKLPTDQLTVLNKVVISIFLLTLIIWIFILIREIRIWSTPISFYSHMLQYTQSARIYNNLGMAYAEINEVDKALEFYLKALELSDQYPQIYHNLGNVYESTNEVERAIQAYQQAIILNPDFYYSYLPLYRLLLKKDQLEADKLFTFINERNPKYAQSILKQNSKIGN